jgi:uncharacterized membrane protein YdjX (TVP38/TMEM64 family)
MPDHTSHNKNPEIPDSQNPRIPDSQNPRIPEFQNPRIPDSQNPRIPEFRNFRIKTYLPILAALITLLLLPRLLGLAGLNQEWLKQVCSAPGGYGELIYLGLGGILVGIGFSRQVVCFLGGFVFGPGKGLVLATMASGLGCLLAVGAARLFRSRFRNRFGSRLDKIDAFLSQNSFHAAMAIRFLPVGSNLLTNVGAGVSRISVPGFFWGSMIGYLPQTVIFTVMGSGVGVSSYWMITMGTVLLGASALLSQRMFRSYRREMSGE